MSSYLTRTFRKEVGRRLRERREFLGLTQEQVAWGAGIAQGSISHYEHGKNEVPLGVLIALCRTLGVSPVDIVPALGSPTTAEPAARAS